MSSELRKLRDSPQLRHLPWLVGPLGGSMTHWCTHVSGGASATGLATAFATGFTLSRVLRAGLDGWLLATSVLATGRLAAGSGFVGVRFTAGGSGLAAGRLAAGSGFAGARFAAGGSGLAAGRFVAGTGFAGVRFATGG